MPAPDKGVERAPYSGVDDADGDAWETEDIGDHAQADDFGDQEPPCEAEDFGDQAPPSAQTSAQVPMSVSERVALNREKAAAIRAARASAEAFTSSVNKKTQKT